MIAVNKKIGRPNVSYSPAFYKKAIKNYRNGDLKDLIALMEQAETDSHVSGCLMGRRAGFKREWMVNEFSDANRDLEIADFIKTVFSGLDMRDLFEDIQDARMKKYSVINLHWEVENGRQVVIDVEKLHQRFFKYDKDDVLKIDFATNQLREIPVDGALVCETRKQPLFLPVLRDYILKEFGLESWASFIETFGEAFIIGKYPPGADADVRQELEDGVNALAMASRGVMPQNTEIDIIETGRNTGDHQKFTEQADKGISISILGHANAVADSSGMKIGENLAPYKVRRELAIDDIYFIEHCVNKLIKVLIDRNYDGGQYPTFSIDKSGPIDISERMQVLEFAWKTGYKIHPNEIAKLGLFKYDDQEDALVKPLTELDFLD